MIRAELKNGTIWLSADPESANLAQRIHGAYRTGKMQPLTWMCPLNYEVIDDLKREKVRVTPELAQCGRAMLRIREYVETQKLAQTVDPMRAIPIKTGYRLFNHQVKAFNIALALFGYDAQNIVETKEGDVHVHVQ